MPQFPDPTDSYIVVNPENRVHVLVPLTDNILTVNRTKSQGTLYHALQNIYTTRINPSLPPVLFQLAGEGHSHMDADKFNIFVQFLLGEINIIAYATGKTPANFGSMLDKNHS